MNRKTPKFADDVVTFATVADLRIYIKKLRDHYMQQVDRYGAKAGELMRERLKEEEGTAKPNGAANKDKAKAPDWRKMGSLWVNTTDTLLGMNDVTLQQLSESKEKLYATEEALKSFEDFKQFIIAPGSSFLLLLKDGVPERILVERPKTDIDPDTAKPKA